MKPERRLELVEVVYWSCPIRDHRHRTQEIAARCCAKESRAEPGRPRNRWTHETLAAIGEWCAKGATVAQIAAEYGVTAEHMKGIVARWERHVRLTAAANELHARLKGGKHGV